MENYRTPYHVIHKMVELLEIKSQDSVLEPSAGQGDIADILRKVYKTNCDCVELNSKNRDILKSKGHNVVGADFLRFDGRYSKIIAVPPYKDNIDTSHIRRMYEVSLNFGGRIVALTHPDWVTGFFSFQKYFREWLSEIPHKMIMMQDWDRYLGMPPLALVLDKP